LPKQRHDDVHKYTRLQGVPKTTRNTTKTNGSIIVVMRFSAKCSVNQKEMLYMAKVSVIRATRKWCNSDTSKDLVIRV